MTVLIRHKAAYKIQVGQEFKVTPALSIRVNGIGVAYEDPIDKSPDVMITACQCHLTLDTYALPTIQNLYEDLGRLGEAL